MSRRSYGHQRIRAHKSSFPNSRSSTDRFKPVIIGVNSANISVREDERTKIIVIQGYLYGHVQNWTFWFPSVLRHFSSDLTAKSGSKICLLIGFHICNLTVLLNLKIEWWYLIIETQLTQQLRTPWTTNMGTSVGLAAVQAVNGQQF